MFTEMEIDDIIYRLADKSDAVALTDLHMKCYSSKENLIVAFGRSYVLSVYRWLLSIDTSIIVVAVFNERIIGSYSVFLGSYNMAMLKATFWSLILGILKKPLLLLRKEVIGRIFHTFFRNRKYIKISELGVAQGISINVDVTMRRRRIAFRMSEIVCDICRNRGCKKLVSITYLWNEASKKKNISLGFKEIQENSSRSRCYFELDL